jgi:hypothetical protein
MKTFVRIALVAVMAFIATSGARAQEWTKAQKEVWQVVEDGWKYWQTGNVDGLAAITHPKYQGWDNKSFLPYSKDKSMQQYQEWKDFTKLDYYDIEPARITVIENAAVVDYYYNYSITITQGDKKETKDSKGRNAEFYVKEGGKWLLLGDMTTRE